MKYRKELKKRFFNEIERELRKISEKEDSLITYWHKLRAVTLELANRCWVERKK